jgi:hypothetical protein
MTLIIEYTVFYSNHDPITFCGKFKSIEDFNFILNLPYSSFYKNKISHQIISTKITP